jgi:hypothetical protein
MSCTDNLVDLQYGRKVHGSNRHRLGISLSTELGRLLSVRARICHPLQHVSRSATALAKRLPGPHARPGELRDGAIESLDQCGDTCVLCLEQKVAHLKWHGQIRWISQCVPRKWSLFEVRATIWPFPVALFPAQMRPPGQSKGPSRQFCPRTGRLQRPTRFGDFLRLASNGLFSHSQSEPTMSSDFVIHLNVNRPRAGRGR